MRRIKPVWISILTFVVFAGALAVGMTTDWWQTDGRKTPLSISKEHDTAVEQSAEDGLEAEEEHESTSVTGSSTVQDALDLGITMTQIEAVLGAPVDEPSASIKAIATERGLKFGEVKDALNALIE